MNCQTTQQLFSDYVDGELAPAERKAVEEHLQACVPCTSEMGHFTRSLQALHETKPVETTRVFAKNLRTAATAHLERGQLWRETGIEPHRVEVRAATPAWVPYALAAVTLLAFGVGYLVQGRGRDRQIAELRRAIEKEFAARRPDPVVKVVRPSDEAILREHGLEKVGDQWLPASVREAFQKGKVLVGGAAMERKAAAELLAREFPPERPPVTPPQPAPSVDEIFEKHGLVRMGEAVVPKDWVARWAEGLVQTGMNEWRKPSNFKEAFIREHNLVDVNGKLMTREQADEIAALQLVRRPDASVAPHAVARALEGLRIGAPMNHRGLTLYPLLGAGAPEESPFVTLHAALGSGKFEIVDSGNVFSVQAKNQLDQDVLLLAGEILTGGRCARVVAEDTVVRKSGAVSVLCVEPPAWKAGGDRFARESGHSVAPLGVRRALVSEQGQGAVWALLARKVDKARPGAADLFRKHADAIADYRTVFAALPEREPGAVGVAVALGDALEAVELFQNRSHFLAYFERIVAAAALELLERPADLAARPAAAVPNSVKGVKLFLENAFLCVGDPRDGLVSLRRDQDRLGRASVSGDVLRHALLFAPATSGWDRRGPAAVPPEKMTRAVAELEARWKTAGRLQKTLLLRELAALGAPPAVAALVGHLGESDPELKRAAIRELGAAGDLHATEPLVQLMSRSRKEREIFAECARALARLGDERSVDALLKHVDGGEADLARAVVQCLPELLLQIRSRELLERAMRRLIDIYEAADAALQGTNLPDPVTRNLKPTDAVALSDASYVALRQVTGRDLEKPINYRRWWNQPENREQFLRERTGK